MRYFSKEIVSNPVILPSGRGIRWEAIGKDRGVVALNIDDLSDELAALHKAGRGGVVEINAAEYEDLKKKADLSSPPVPRLGEPYIDTTPVIARQGVENLVAGGGKKPKSDPTPKVSAEQHTKPPLGFGLAQAAANKPRTGKPPAPPKGT